MGQNKIQGVHVCVSLHYLMNLLPAVLVHTADLCVIVQ